MTKLSSITTNSKEHRESMMDKEVVNQHFALIKILDDLLKDNEQLKNDNKKIVQQNDQITELLTKIANK